MNYPVGDFLIQVKNAAMAKRREVIFADRKQIREIAYVLKEKEYFDEVEKEDGKLKIRLTYIKKEPALISLKLISKPGLRIYMSVDELEKVKSPSFFIVSTSKGVMTSKDAIKKRVGGEIIAEIL